MHNSKANLGDTFCPTPWELVLRALSLSLFYYLGTTESRGHSQESLILTAAHTRDLKQITSTFLGLVSSYVKWGK